MVENDAECCFQFKISLFEVADRLGKPFLQLPSFYGFRIHLVIADLSQSYTVCKEKRCAPTFFLSVFILRDEQLKENYSTVHSKCVY